MFASKRKSSTPLKIQTAVEIVIVPNNTDHLHQQVELHCMWLTWFLQCPCIHECKAQKAYPFSSFDEFDGNKPVQES